MLNQEILDFFKTEPPVYQKSTKAFWDDEHISKGMLSAHLDIYHDGASRKISSIQKSSEWICGCFENTQGKQLLDLGCGPGIYAELLYDQGFSVTGLDFSKRSIAYAQKHAEKTGRKIPYVYQNYLEMDYENVFDIILLIYYDFGVLSPDERGVLLNKINRAMKKNGVLILDVLNQSYRDIFQETQSIQYENGGFWSPEPYVVVQQNKFYEKTNNTLEQYLVITEKQCEHFYIWNQIYTKETFTSEIEKNGFQLIGIYDDVCGAAFTGKGEGICGIFEKAE